MKRKVTRNDVAKMAGVSPTVVSYVMNNSNYVSKEKREAVLKAIKELEYTPNVFAKGLKTNHSNQIALVGDSLQGELFGELAAGLFSYGYHASLFYSQVDDTFIRRIIESRFDAVFMTSNAFEARHLNEIVESGIPLILYESREYVGLDPRIVVRAPDFYSDVKKSLNYLILKGHTRIAYIPPLKYKTGGVHGDDFRARAYVDTLRDNGLEVIPDFFCTQTKTVSDILDAVFSMLTARTREQCPTAFVVGDDHLAAQVMQALKKFGMRVPEDLAVVGWGNIPSSQITTPELTTVDSGIKLFAREVTEALMELVDGRQPEDRLYKGELVIRGST